MRGRVTEEAAGTPVRGAIVSLVTAAGQRVAPTLTSDDGCDAVSTTAPGVYRLRVDLIGYQRWLSPEFALRIADSVLRDVRLPLQHVQLAAVEVRGASACASGPAPSTRGADAVAIWEEVLRALTLVELSQKHRIPFELRVAERLVRAQSTLGATVRSRDRTEIVRPWTTASPALLVSDGWVRREGDSLTFYGPGIDALLPSMTMLYAALAHVSFRFGRQATGDAALVREQ